MLTKVSTYQISITLCYTVCISRPNRIILDQAINIIYKYSISYIIFIFVKVSFRRVIENSVSSIYIFVYMYIKTILICE